jgi:hypothetical protein
MKDTEMSWYSFGKAGRKWEDNIKFTLGNRLLLWEADGTGLELCSVVGFGVSGVESLCFTTRELGS